MSTATRLRTLRTGARNGRSGGRAMRRASTIATVAVTIAAVAVGLSAPAQAYTAPASVGFGGVFVNQSKTLHIPITPDAGLVVAGATGSAVVAPWSFSVGTCADADPGQACVVDETLSPRPSDAGDLVADLTLYTCPHFLGDPLSACTAITIHLTGYMGVGQFLDPDPVDFGVVPIGQSVTRDVTYSMDTGFTFAGLTDVGGFDQWGLSNGNCSQATGTCTMQQTFTPTQVGKFTNELQVVECSGTVCFTTGAAVLGTGAAVTTGSMSVTPGAVDPTDTVSATSTTSCPTGTASVTLSLYATDGSLIASGPPPLVNGSGHWAGPITVPATAPPGPEFVTATCRTSEGFALQYYNYAPLTVRRQRTATTLTTPANPVDYGQPITLAGTVELTTAGSHPQGSLSFLDGSTHLGAPVPVDASGHGSLTVPTLSVGSHTLTASYTGDQLASSATLKLVVRKAPTQLALAPATRANPTVFSARLTSDGTPVAGLPVSFTAKNLFGGATAMCTATTDSNGVATCNGKSASQLRLDPSYTAKYAGNVDYLASTATAKFS